MWWLSVCTLKVLDRLHGHTYINNSEILHTFQFDLFVDAPPDVSSEDDNDSTDSAESEFSGLEEEEDSSEGEDADDEVESINVSV